MLRVSLAVAIASLSIVACGSDSSTSEGAVAVSASTAPSSNVASNVSSPATSESVRPSALLVSELPEISGPTVLWFWAPG